MGVSYEDLEVGKAYEIGSHTFGREEIVQFAQQYDPQPFHLSEAAGEASHFGGLVASGWHTCSVMMGLLVRNFLEGSTSMGSPGIDEIRWIKPVRVGDTITLTNNIVSKRISQSKPDRGIVETRWDCRNQHGGIVASVSLRTRSCNFG